MFYITCLHFSKTSYFPWLCLSCEEKEISFSTRTATTYTSRHQKTAVSSFGLKIELKISLMWYAKKKKCCSKLHWGTNIVKRKTSFSNQLSAKPSYSITFYLWLDAAHFSGWVREKAAPEEGEWMCSCHLSVWHLELLQSHENIVLTGIRWTWQTAL